MPNIVHCLTLNNTIEFKLHFKNSREFFTKLSSNMRYFAGWFHNTTDLVFSLDETRRDYRTERLDILRSNEAYVCVVCVRQCVEHAHSTTFAKKLNAMVEPYGRRR